jgi:hypothetical protein
LERGKSALASNHRGRETLGGGGDETLVLSERRGREKRERRGIKKKNKIKIKF